MKINTHMFQEAHGYKNNNKKSFLALMKLDVRPCCLLLKVTSKCSRSVHRVLSRSHQRKTFLCGLRRIHNFCTRRTLLNAEMR